MRRSPERPDEAGTLQSVLQHRVSARLAELRLSARAASLRAGLGPDAIRIILSGRSKSPRSDTLVALAGALQCEVGYLMGTQEKPFASVEFVATPEFAKGVTTLIVQGGVRLGWSNSEQNQDEWFSTDINTLPQYLPGYQHLLSVEDASFDVYFRPGTLIHVLYSPFSDDAAVRDGDIVVLWRQRSGDTDANGGEWERSLRLVRQIGPEVVMLDTASTNPRLRESVMWAGPDVQPPRGEGSIRLHKPLGHALMIEGLVLRAYTHLTGPPIVGARHEDEAQAIESAKMASGNP